MKKNRNYTPTIRLRSHEEIQDDMLRFHERNETRRLALRPRKGDSIPAYIVVIIIAATAAAYLLIERFIFTP
jgi:hypothetical protein